MRRASSDYDAGTRVHFEGLADALRFVAAVTDEAIPKELERLCGLNTDEFTEGDDNLVRKFVDKIDRSWKRITNPVYCWFIERVKVTR